MLHKKSPNISAARQNQLISDYSPQPPPQPPLTPPPPPPPPTPPPNLGLLPSPRQDGAQTIFVVVNNRTSGVCRCTVDQSTSWGLKFCSDAKDWASYRELKVLF